MTPPRRPSRGLALPAVLLGLVVAGCGPSGPTATPTATATASLAPSQTPGASAAPSVAPTTVYRAIEEQVLEIRGLEAKEPVDPKVLDEAALTRHVQTSFREDNPAELVAANERLLKGLGLLEPDASLEDLYIELLTSQVAGLYDPDGKELYVVSKTGNLGPTEKTTFAHEYTHALQDQNFGLGGLELDVAGEGDRAIARLSLVEGDATLVMTLWQIGNLSQAEILQLFTESLDPKVTGALEKMPPVLRESLLFPYTGGLNFAQTLHGSGGWAAIDAAYEILPGSTEQILHPEKYVSGEAPIKVDLPDDLDARMGAGWSVGLEDTLGEFQLRVWLAEAGAGEAAGAREAGAGWGGDRTIILDGPDDAYAIAIASEWDSSEDASEFVTKATVVVDGLAGSGSVYWPVGGTSATVVLASSSDLAARLANVLGLAG